MALLVQNTLPGPGLVLPARLVESRHRVVKAGIKPNLKTGRESEGEGSGEGRPPEADETVLVCA